MSSLTQHIVQTLNTRLVVHTAYHAPHNHSTHPAHCITKHMEPSWKLLMQTLSAPDKSIQLERVARTDGADDFIWINVSTDLNSEPLFTLKYLPHEHITLNNLCDHIDHDIHNHIHNPHALRNAIMTPAPLPHSHITDLIRTQHTYAAMCHEANAIPDSRATSTHFQNIRNRGQGQGQSWAHNVLVFHQNSFAPQLLRFVRELVHAFANTDLWRGHNIRQSDVQVSLHRVKTGGFAHAITDPSHDTQGPAVLLFLAPPSTNTPALRIHHHKYNFALAHVPMIPNSALFFDNHPDLLLQHTDPVSMRPNHSFGQLHYLHFQARSSRRSALHHEGVRILPASTTPRICYV